jgi:proliferating cell nuclear antigen
MTDEGPTLNLQCRLNQGDVFKKLVASMLELCNECNFECTENGICCQNMDSSHVSLVAVKLNADGFEEFQCSEEFILGMNLTNLNKVLKCSGSKDSMSITATTTEEVQFAFENEAGDQKSEFTLKLMTVDEEHLQIPETEYKAVVTMPSSEFARICRDLKEIGESVTISCSKKGVTFECTGDIGSAKMDLSHNQSEDDKSSIKIEMEEPISQQFALRYLSSFAKSSGLSSQVVLSFSDDTPLQVSFKMEDLGSIKYFLAPKIEDED